MFVSSCVGEGVIVLDRRVGMRELLIIVDSGNKVAEDWVSEFGWVYVINITNRSTQ